MWRSRGGGRRRPRRPTWWSRWVTSSPTWWSRWVAWSLFTSVMAVMIISKDGGYCLPDGTLATNAMIMVRFNVVGVSGYKCHWPPWISIMIGKADSLVEAIFAVIIFPQSAGCNFIMKNVPSHGSTRNKIWDLVHQRHIAQGSIGEDLCSREEFTTALRCTCFLNIVNTGHIDILQDIN